MVPVPDTQRLETSQKEQDLWVGLGGYVGSGTFEGLTFNCGSSCQIKQKKDMQEAESKTGKPGEANPKAKAGQAKAYEKQQKQKQEQEEHKAGRKHKQKQEQQKQKTILQKQNQDAAKRKGQK